MADVIRKLDGANMDIALTTDADDIVWEQDKCPWNEAEGIHEHRCAVKSVSICQYFCGVEFMDYVLGSYPNANPYRTKEQG